LSSQENIELAHQSRGNWREVREGNSLILWQGLVLVELAWCRLPSESEPRALLAAFSASFTEGYKLAATNPALIGPQEGFRNEVLAFLCLQVRTLDVV
jgi:hypothetical protein